jgi:hypothetical protein
MAWGCVVYDSELLSDDSGLSGSGNTGAESGRAGMGSGGASSAGKASTGGGKANGGTGSTTGGTPMIEGGAPAEEGGAGNEPMAGTGGGGVSGGGTGGAGGKGGSAGSAGKGGGGGSAGTPSTVKCSDHPLTLKSTWTDAASISSLGNGMESDGLYNPPEHLTDALPNERWSTGKPQSGDEWIQIDFGAVVTLSQITMQIGSNINDWPRGYAIRVSNLDAVSNVAAFSAPVLASGAGAASTDVVVSLAEPVEGRYLLVRQTGVVEPPAMSWWTITEVLVGCVD